MNIGLILPFRNFCFGEKKIIDFGGVLIINMRSDFQGFRPGKKELNKNACKWEVDYIVRAITYINEGL